MASFYLHRDDQEQGPLSATDLRALGGVRPGDLVRHGEEGPWLHLSELLVADAEAVEALDDALEPDEPGPEGWETRPLAELSWVALLLSADGFFIVRTAMMGASLAGWANALILLGTMAVAVYGLLARRPWAWPLTALVLGTMSAWLLAPLVASGGTGTAVWLGVNVLAAAFVLYRRPRGPALDWGPSLRRLLLMFSTDPDAEGRSGPRRSRGTGPLAALLGSVLFFGLVVGGVFLYHRLRYPGLDAHISLVPRGGDTWARLAATSVYLLMVLLAWLLARRGRPAVVALGMTLRQGARRTLWTGARLFLALFLVLLTGRWLLRTAEAVEQRIEEARGDGTPVEATATEQVREAVRGVVDRPARTTSLSLWVLVVALLLGPVCEEIFFRGLLFGGLRRKWPFWAAALLSATVFAAAHWLGSSWGAATPVLLFEVAAGGVAAAYAYELTGSLLAPISLHVLWNAATTLSGMIPGS